MYLLGVDCGATNLRVGIVDEKGGVIAFEKAGSPLRHNPDQFAQKVKNIAENLLKGAELVEGNIEGIGVGVPGPLDLEQGLLLKSSNLGNENPINLKHQFELLFNSKAYFDLDAHVALRGEAWVGAAADCQQAVMLTLGTGVGGAILDNGQIQLGSKGMAGEIGHTYLATQLEHQQGMEIPTCGLGHKGCLEAFIKHAKDLEEIGLYLGVALANLVDIFNPQKIIIGGGMIKQGDFLPKAIEVMKQKGMKPASEEVIVQYAQLGDLSGVIGSAKLALDSLKK